MINFSKNLQWIILLLFSSVAIGQEIDLTDLDQLSNTANSGKIIRINKSFNLNGKTITIAPDITLKPAGGILSNGTLKGKGYSITTSKKNQTFNNNLVFGDIYTKTFLPEWFGAKPNNNSKSDAVALQKSIASATVVKLDDSSTYFLDTPININRFSSITIRGNNAKIITSGFKSGPMISLGEKFSQVNIEDLKIDGRNNTAEGIVVRSNLKAKKLDLQNFYAELEKSYALRLIIKKRVNASIDTCYINNVRGLNNGKIGDGIGASRGIIIEWEGDFPGSEVVISRNKIVNILGEDGDNIQIAQTKGSYKNSNKTIIKDNKLYYGTRRFIKASASNIEVYKNHFKPLPIGHPDEQLIKDRTYMVAFQQFDPIDKLNGEYVLGAKFIDNTFKFEPNYNFGSGACLGFQQTSGAIITDNTFNNGKVTFRRFNKKTVFQKNTLNNTIINFPENAYVFDNFKIYDNTGNVDFRKQFKTPRSVVQFDQYNTIKNFIFQKNRIIVYDEGGKIPGSEKRDKQDIALISIDDSSLVDNIIVKQNTFTKKTPENLIPSIPVLLRSKVKFGEPSVVSDNKIIADVIKPEVGLNFIKICDHNFTYFNNTDKNNNLLVPKIDKNFCNNKSQKFINETDIIEVTTNSIKLNTHDVFINYKIFNMLGEQVLKGSNKTSTQINLNNLPTGIYFLSSKYNNKLITKKFIKN